MGSDLGKNGFIASIVSVAVILVMLLILAMR
jgi:hypothetical protein